MKSPAATFRVALLGLFTAGCMVSFRAASASALNAELLTPADPVHAAEKIGVVLGAAFLSFAISLVVTSSLLPAIGFRRALLGAVAMLSGGILAMVGASHVSNAQTAYHALIFATAMQGIGWGLIEASVNPLVSVLMPEDRTHRLSILHAWYPAGLVAGSLISVGSAAMGWAWQGMALLFVALALLLGWCTCRVGFPPVLSRDFDEGPASFGAMFAVLVRQPSILFWFLLMMMTASTEFAPGQWVDLALSHTVGMRGILLLACVSGLMFVMRHFAGPIERRLSRLGMLTASSLLSSLGLLALARADSPVTALLAATLWGGGVCFLWPTMLATVATRYPAGGPLVMGLMAASGAMSTYVVLPILGTIYDRAKLDAAGGAAALAVAKGPKLDAILAEAARVSFDAVAIIPLALILIFGTLLIVGRRR